MPKDFQGCKERVLEAVNSMMLCWLTCPDENVLLESVAVSRSIYQLLTSRLQRL